MAYNVPKYMNLVALVCHDLTNRIRILRDDTDVERVFTAEEHATFARWIQQFEQISREADAIVKDWTALPGKESAGGDDDRSGCTLS